MEKGALTERGGAESSDDGTGSYECEEWDCRGVMMAIVVHVQEWRFLQEEV